MQISLSPSTRMRWVAYYAIVTVFGFWNWQAFAIQSDTPIREATGIYAFQTR